MCRPSLAARRLQESLREVGEDAFHARGHEPVDFPALIHGPGPHGEAGGGRRGERAGGDVILAEVQGSRSDALCTRHGIRHGAAVPQNGERRVRRARAQPLEGARVERREDDARERDERVLRARPAGAAVRDDERRHGDRLRPAAFLGQGELTAKLQTPTPCPCRRRRPPGSPSASRSRPRSPMRSRTSSSRRGPRGCSPKQTARTRRAPVWRRPSLPRPRGRSSRRWSAISRASARSRPPRAGRRSPQCRFPRPTGTRSGGGITGRWRSAAGSWWPPRGTCRTRRAARCSSSSRAWRSAPGSTRPRAPAWRRSRARSRRARSAPRSTSAPARACWRWRSRASGWGAWLRSTPIRSSCRSRGRTSRATEPDAWLSSPDPSPPCAGASTWWWRTCSPRPSWPRRARSRARSARTGGWSSRGSSPSSSPPWPLLFPGGASPRRAPGPAGARSPWFGSLEVLRLFVPGAGAEGPRLRLTGTHLRHLRAHRVCPGERFLVFDDRGAEHEARLERLGGRLAEATILATHRPLRESPLDLVLAPALLKGAKMDLVIEKAIELGVRRVAPVVSRHAVGLGVRLERWRRIAVAAAEQCGRTSVPPVDAPLPLAELVRAPWSGLRLIAWEGERDVPLAALPARTDAVVILIGPEGGFAAEEVAAARAHGFRSVRLAPRVLRAETAAIAAAALCQHRWGDLSTAPAVR